MKQRIQTLLLTLGVFLLPVLALADDDEKPQPMSAHDKMIQSWAWFAVFALIVIPAVWYQIRKWQIVHSGNTTDGMRGNQD